MSTETTKQPIIYCTCPKELNEDNRGNCPYCGGAVNCEEDDEQG